MKVLIVYHSASLEPSKAIFAAMAKNPNIELRVLGPKKGWNRLRGTWQEIPETIKQDGYALIPGRVFRGRKDFSGPYMLGLLKEMREFKPDIIHVFNEAISLVVIQAIFFRNIFLPKAKVLFFGFENIFPDNLPNKNWKMRFAWKFLNRYLDGGTYANSEGMERLTGLGLKKPKMKLTYWGIPLQSYGPKDSTELRENMGLKGKLLLGYIGRIEKEKGLDTVIQALKKLPDDISFMTVGSGQYLDNLKESARVSGIDKRYISIERVNSLEVSKYLSLFDLFVLPSENTPTWKEQFGRVLPEAMACGIPILGSSSGAIPEVVGEAGFVFQEADVDDFAKKVKVLHKMSDVQRISLTDKARQRAENEFSLKSFSNRLINFYKVVLYG